MDKIKKTYTVEKENNKIFIKFQGELNKQSYEYKILEEDNLNNMPSKMSFDYEKYACSYKIKGETLEDYAKKTLLKKKDLIDLIEDIDDFLYEVENYLLSENSIILDMKSICRDEKGLYYFTMVPNANLDFSYELSKFLIRILRYVDVNDKEALSLGYNLFIKSSEDNYTINDLLEVCHNNDNVKFVEELSMYDKIKN